MPRGEIIVKSRLFEQEAVKKKDIDRITREAKGMLSSNAKSSCRKFNEMLAELDEEN
jgi:hypothetical protein